MSLSTLYTQLDCTNFLWNISLQEGQDDHDSSTDAFKYRMRAKALSHKIDDREGK